MMAEQSGADTSRSMSRRRLAIIVLAALVIAAVFTFSLLYLSSKNKQRVKGFKSYLKGDWETVEDETKNVAAAMSRTESPTDLTNLSTASGKMRSEVQDIMTRREGTCPPSWYRIVLNRENTALASLESYLELVSHLVKEANVDTLGQSLSLLENRARRARSDIIIWSLVSSHRQNSLELLGANKEKVLGNWRAAWGNEKPEDFFVSKSQVSFPAADNAISKVVV